MKPLVTQTRERLSEHDMAALAEQLAVASKEQGLVWYLQGDLGAGKTTLCRHFLRAYGITGAIKSPTYTLVEPYHTAARDLYHFDLYRVVDSQELEAIGIRDYFTEDACVLVEWPEQGETILPTPDLLSEITITNTTRKISFHAYTPKGQALLATV